MFNILLQVLEDGVLTDSQGRHVDFRNTVIILTSNLGSSLILDGINESGEICEEARRGVEELLKRSFRPEFLNRLDQTVFYKPLTREDMKGIVDLLLENLRRRLADKQLSLAVTDRAKEHIIACAYDPSYGARPLKRFIQSAIETLIARVIIGNDPAPGDTLTVDVEDGRLTVK